MTPQLERLAIDTIRTLAIDAVQKANSGHPGAPMGAAPMAFVLWTRFLRHAPTRADWVDRDRFVLSAGHASMLLYALLYLTGYGLELDELQQFRQWGSRTPGHPEHGLTPGVEATTGPLGQGFANAVGMAIAERRLATEFNRPDHEIVDHRTFVIASDGDLQEGVQSEAASLAGHLKLGKLLVLYDDNHIQLDGPTDMAWSEDVLRRYEAYGWGIGRVGDGNDLSAIDAAIRAGLDDERPTLIAVRTHIGFGSPNKQDTQKAHGQPLGEDEVRLTKEAYGWDPDRQFYVPDDVLRVMRGAVERGEAWYRDWEARYYRYRDAYPEHAGELRRRTTGLGLREGWDTGLKTYAVGEEAATRQASQAAIQALSGPVPELFGGSADLSESNLTLVKDGGDFEADEAGRNLWFGVREHGMGGAVNGVAYHGGFIPYAATFLNFSDYMRGAVRLSALAGLHVIYVWTHDSVGLGEDGPTHQPVEHYAALRAMPNLWFVRPGDPNEATAAWAFAVQRAGGPVALSLTRQKLPALAGTGELAREGLARGGYVLRRARGEEAGVAPDLLLIATGSELQLAFAAAEALETDSIGARVVSLPCWEQFEEQDQGYRDSVIPPTVRRRVTIEAGASTGWERYAGDEGAIIGIDHFGASAPAGTIFAKLGFTPERVTDVAQRVVRDGLRGRIPTIDPGHQPPGLHNLLGDGGGDGAGHGGATAPATTQSGSAGRDGAGHPSVPAGDPGVARTPGSDPGHS